MGAKLYLFYCLQCKPSAAPSCTAIHHRGFGFSTIRKISAINVFGKNITSLKESNIFKKLSECNYRQIQKSLFEEHIDGDYEYKQFIHNFLEFVIKNNKAEKHTRLSSSEAWELLQEIDFKYFLESAEKKFSKYLSVISTYLIKIYPLICFGKLMKIVKINSFSSFQ